MASGESDFDMDPRVKPEGDTGVVDAFLTRGRIGGLSKDYRYAGSLPLSRMT